MKSIALVAEKFIQQVQAEQSAKMHIDPCKRGYEPEGGSGGARKRNGCRLNCRVFLENGVV
jgi:hypothetical protein